MDIATSSTNSSLEGNRYRSPWSSTSEVPFDAAPFLGSLASGGFVPCIEPPPPPRAYRLGPMATTAPTEDPRQSSPSLSSRRLSRRWDHRGHTLWPRTSSPPPRTARARRPRRCPRKRICHRGDCGTSGGLRSIDRRTRHIPNEPDIVQQTLPTRGHGRRLSYQMTRRHRCHRRQLHSRSSSPLFVFVALVVRTLVVVVIIIPRRRQSHRVDVPRMLDPSSSPAPRTEQVQQVQTSVEAFQSPPSGTGGQNHVP